MADTANLDFDRLIKVAEGLKAKKAALVAQRDAALKQKEQIIASLVSKYGDGYMTKFLEAVQKVQDYEAQGAA